jgi:hypothetical protein
MEERVETWGLHEYLEVKAISGWK